MSVRLKDIAAELGVSTVTVSKVIRNEGRISLETRERILKRIKELNYHPNVAARSLVSGRTFLVGLIVPDLMHPFFAAMAKSVTHALRAHGYSVAISSAEEDPGLEDQEINSFLARRVDALILASSDRRAAGIQRIEQQRVPYVLADRLIPGVKGCFVGSDDRAIGLMATRHLIERGYCRIAHIRMPGISTGKRRYEGYVRALQERGETPRPQFTIDTHSADIEGEQSGRNAMTSLLALKPPPDAVFCYNDIVACGALDAILQANLRVPEDVAVIGVSNLSGLSFWSTPRVPLSTIDQDVPKIGDTAAALVLDLIENRQPSTKKVFVTPKLVVRNST